MKKTIPMAFFVIVVCAESWNSRKAPPSHDSSEGGGRERGGQGKGENTSPTRVSSEGGVRWWY
jgi:hypothetical protein